MKASAKSSRAVWAAVLWCLLIVAAAAAIVLESGAPVIIPVARAAPVRQPPAAQDVTFIGVVPNAPDPVAPQPQAF